MKNSTRILQIEAAAPGLWARFKDGPDGGQRLPVVLFALVEFEDEKDCSGLLLPFKITAVKGAMLKGERID